MQQTYDVIIVGAGLAGLSAALELEKFELNSLVVERDDRAGGRIKTDERDGFLLDRGFQVYLDAYPEGRQILDYAALNLKKYRPGALCFDSAKKFQVADTARNKWALPRMAFSPVGNFMDKIRLGNLVARLRKTGLEEIFGRPEHTTLEYLQQLRFSDKIIDRFFRPFLAGIFLERQLDTSSRMFEFVLKMMAEGHATLPARGMEAIPRQIKDRLQRTEFRFHTEVEKIDAQELRLKNGETLRARQIIVAASPEKLLDQWSGTNEWRSTAHYYFSADQNPLPQGTLALSFDPEGLVSNFSVPSSIAPHYAPKGKHLISVSLRHLPKESEEEVSQDIKNELTERFGSSVQGWQFLQSYHLRQALPVMNSLRHTVPIDKTRIRDGLYLAGDQFLNPSINAAMVSGRLAAQAAIKHHQVQ